MDTIEANHKNIPGAGHGVIEKNKSRADIEEAARKAGLDVVVNVVINSRREIAGVFVGDMVKAHREGVKFAREIYKTEVPRGMDIIVTNAYPLDTEMFQAVKALWMVGHSSKKDGITILLSACSEGRGYHALYQMGGRLWAPPERSWLKREPSRAQAWRKRLLFASPNLNKKDLHQIYPEEETELLRSWEETLEELKSLCKERIKVAVFPCASIQVE